MLRELRTTIGFACCLAVACLSQVAAGAAQPEELPLAPAVECTPRNGLPNFFARLAKGGEVKIAYLGGSITAQEGWRPKTLAMFQKMNPAAKVSQINAAIGGTGSDLGVFRLGHDVLEHKPDLLFVEFAVNDGGAQPKQIYRCMEGIVRQTWRALPECDICFVYTITDSLIPPLFEGKFQRSASAMEMVAGHYGIPSIHMGLEVARLAKEGKLLLRAKKPTTDEEKKALGDKVIFAADGVHPFPETGHELYLAAVERSVPKMKAAPGQPGPHALAAPFVADNFEQAKLVPISKAKLSSGFTKLDPAKDPMAKRFVARLGEMYKANQPGQTVEFKFRGRYASVYDLVGPDCGQVIVTLDGGKPAVRPRFDAYCTYHRLATLGIGSDLPDAVHTVKIEIHPEQPDKARILAQRKEKMDNPKRFDDRAWYPGAILVVGDVVE